MVSESVLGATEGGLLGVTGTVWHAVSPITSARLSLCHGRITSSRAGCNGAVIVRHSAACGHTCLQELTRHGEGKERKVGWWGGGGAMVD